jgi:hypothetical protein
MARNHAFAVNIKDYILYRIHHQHSEDARAHRAIAGSPFTCLKGKDRAILTFTSLHPGRRLIAADPIRAMMER